MRTLPLVLAALLAPLCAQAPLPKGELIPRVTCAAMPEFSYALYIPPGLDLGRPAPVLLAFSPSGKGEEPVRLFQKVADRFGWIVAGSNDSRNGPVQPALEAAEATWKDVNVRFKVVPRRAYATGFSGGARMALRLARNHPTAFAGLASFGAFWMEDRHLAGLGHVGFYLAGGSEDFNHWELVEAREELRSRRWTALADRHEGGHQWPTEATSMEAAEFLEWCARKEGLAAPDPGLDEALRKALLARGRAGGETLIGLRRCRDLVALFPESDEARQARGLLRELEGRSAVREEQRLETQYGQEAVQLRTLRGEPFVQALTRYVNRLREAPETEKLMIRRILGEPISEYWAAANEALEHRDWKTLQSLCHSLAALDSREGRACVWAAVASLQQGRPEEALSLLRVALDRGYRNAARLRSLPWLEGLHGREDFKALLAAMEGSAVTPLR